MVPRRASRLHPRSKSMPTARGRSTGSGGVVAVIDAGRSARRLVGRRGRRGARSGHPSRSAPSQESHGPLGRDRPRSARVRPWRRASRPGDCAPRERRPAGHRSTAGRLPAGSRPGGKRKHRPVVVGEHAACTRPQDRRPRHRRPPRTATASNSDPTSRTSRSVAKTTSARTTIGGMTASSSATKTRARNLSAAPPRTAVAAAAGAEAVAQAALGQQVARRVRIGLELATQPADGDPEIGRIGAVRIGPDAVEQLIGRHDAINRRREHVEQSCLGAGELLRARSTSSPTRFARSTETSPPSSEICGDPIDARRRTRWIRATSSSGSNGFVT